MTELLVVCALVLAALAVAGVAVLGHRLATLERALRELWGE